MTSEQFIKENLASVEFWSGFEGKLIGTQDARQACRMAYNEALDACIEETKKHYIHGHTVVNPVMDSLITKIIQLKKDV